VDTSKTGVGSGYRLGIQPDQGLKTGVSSPTLLPRTTIRPRSANFSKNQGFLKQLRRVALSLLSAIDACQREKRPSETLRVAVVCIIFWQEMCKQSQQSSKMQKFIQIVEKLFRFIENKSLRR
jgi:hypothetical protein